MELLDTMIENIGYEKESFNYGHHINLQNLLEDLYLIQEYIKKLEELCQRKILDLQKQL
jgi:hypothetical protein